MIAMDLVMKVHTSSNKKTGCSRLTKGKCLIPAEDLEEDWPHLDCCRVENKEAVFVRVTAKINVGWGRQLFIRGEGGGLDWNVGIPMQNVTEDEWIWETKTKDAVVTFKLLVDDTLWSSGDNYSATCGADVVVAPSFA
jgi:hypothetical protein